MDFKIKWKIIKHLEINIEENLQDVKQGKVSLDLTPEARSVKGKTDELYSIPNKELLVFKRSYQKEEKEDYKCGENVCIPRIQ